MCVSSALRTRVSSAVRMTCCFACRTGVEGYDEMLEHQAVMWPHESCATPRCWDASINLANSSHFDMDASRSFAVWLRTGPGTTRGWYLCFPAHGVALQLDDLGRFGVRVMGLTRHACSAIAPPSPSWGRETNCIPSSVHCLMM